MTFLPNAEGAFQFGIIGKAGSNYAVEVSTDLVTWTPLLTNKSVTGFLIFTQTNTESAGGEFYRATTN